MEEFTFITEETNLVVVEDVVAVMTKRESMPVGRGALMLSRSREDGPLVSTTSLEVNSMSTRGIRRSCDVSRRSCGRGTRGRCNREDNQVQGSWCPVRTAAEADFWSYGRQMVSTGHKWWWRDQRAGRSRRGTGVVVEESLPEVNHRDAGTMVDDCASAKPEQSQWEVLSVVKNRPGRQDHRILGRGRRWRNKLLSCLEFELAL